MDLKGKTAVITGGSRGIGRAAALKFAAEGADVAILYLGPKEEADETVKAVSDLGVRAAAYECNVADFNQSKEIADKVIKDFSCVDVLINNAGITADKLLLRMTEQDWDKVLSVNLKGAFNMIKHFTQHFMRSRSGAIINVSSVSGMMGNAGQANYSASKAGLIGLTKTVARELSSRNVTCNAVAPGFIATNMTAALSEEQQEFLKKNIPLGRVGTPDDVADVMVFFAKNRYITGEVVKVDGGMYI